MQIEYATKVSEQQQQPAIETITTSVPIIIPIGPREGAPQAHRIEDNFERKVRELIAAGDHANQEEIATLPETYLLQYFEALHQANTARQQVITNNRPMPNSAVSSELPVEEIQGDAEEYERIQNQTIERQVQALLSQQNPDLVHVPEIVLMKYFEVLHLRESTPVVSSSSSVVITNNQLERHDNRRKNEISQEFDMDLLEEQFQRAQLVREQNSVYEEAARKDRRKEALREEIEQRQQRIMQSEARIGVLDQQLGSIQVLVSEKEAVTERLSKFPENGNFQKKLRELNTQIPADYPQLKSEFETLTANLAKDRQTQTEASEELARLTKK